MRAIMAHSGFRPHVTLAARSALYHTGPVITVIAVFSSQIDRETHIYLATTARLNAAQLEHLNRVNKSQPAKERIITEKRREEKKHPPWIHIHIHIARGLLKNVGEVEIVCCCHGTWLTNPGFQLSSWKHITPPATRLDFLVDHVTRTWSRSYMDKGRDCLEPASQDERQGKFLVLPFELINHRVKERALLQLESMRAPFFFIIYLPTLTNPAILIERIIPLIIWCSTKLDSFQFIIIVFRFLAPRLCFP